MTIDELYQRPYWIIDILPMQVPKNSPGQYFAIEKYWLHEPHLSNIKQKHINVVLKLNCYRDISFDDESEVNPAPDLIEETIRNKSVNIRVGDAVILSEPDDTHMTLFNPDQDLRILIKAIAESEGLCFWQPGRE